jgi:nucleotide-binding universal stress UspA family protein
MSKVPDFFYDLGEESKYREALMNATGWEIALRDSMNQFMNDARRELIDRGFPQKAVKAIVQDREAGIARDIIGECLKGYAGAILGRSGLSKVRELIMGSVANKLIERLTDVPICVVGGSPDSRKILLALDESEGAMGAVRFVGSLLKDPGKEVMLFHAVRGFNIFERRHGRTVSLKDEQAWMDAYKMDSVFEEAKTHLAGSGFRSDQVDTKILKGVESRANAIFLEAVAGGYGTIVLGRRGLSRVKEFYMGRVSNKVIQLARGQAVWVVP